MVPSHRSPAVTCTPWHPTRVKKEDRKALRLGPAPRVNQARELADLEGDEGEAEQSGGQEGDLRPLLTALTDRKARHPAGKGRGEEAAGLHRRIVQIEQLLRAAGPPAVFLKSTA